jgi:ribonuclease E
LLPCLIHLESPVPSLWPGHIIGIHNAYGSKEGGRLKGERGKRRKAREGKGREGEGRAGKGEGRGGKEGEREGERGKEGRGGKGEVFRPAYPRNLTGSNGD